MSFGNIGPLGFLVILILALIIFGPNKLPELGRAMGTTLKEFKKATQDLTDTSSAPSVSSAPSHAANSDSVKASIGDTPTVDHDTAKHEEIKHV